ncbi:DUF3397 domain-containing protein [Enterococcus sp. DIV0242_7C1]|uniref:Lipoprotein n=1 Tax=Candidatus Enterococcus dunnyi TaxID=1834192 RepID=A0A200J8R0_9ENTE|nr:MULTISPECIES: DUF3397 domain-containing protein [unclassified Enterococcus]MBO0470772.1 DUF3397 domain-containing protein [Enterococcus sp. DIV0242_7C1]MCA5012444.1 DUF3397 domain-containing protein [Enterococcus sp. S23]MCA5015695.1 DUF3397 domain-containing protein [Enterococcus sp. S22(2020)]OUZ33219.1 lipoprotein [Enterococcus sp. 9D6_DIV0238]
MVSFSVIMLFWYVFPVIVLFACNFIISTFSLTERYKVKAPDISIPFLFIGLNELSKDSYGQSIVPYMIISVLLLGICVAVFQAYYYGEILYGRYFKMFWRLVFLLSLILYALLILLNIVHYLA